MRRLLSVLALCAAFALSGTNADAHHSTAEFDYTKVFVARGAVKEFQWTNPHAWVQVLVPNSTGGQDQWGFELGAPIINVRMGWTDKSLTVGDKVTVIFCPSYVPARGTLLQISLPDGRTLNGVAKILYRGPDYSDPSKLPGPAPLAPRK
jgi:hypothetical protein